MDASTLEELVYDPSKCSKLTLDQKRELVYEMSKWSDDATEMLNAWSRQEILQVLCAELGKERKYTGLTKSKIIELLLKIIDEKKSQETATPSGSELHTTSKNGGRTPKRQRKIDHPTHLNVANTVVNSLDADSGQSVYCKNSACKAKMNQGHSFCKRCSCCICRKYDDNKDPSLWLICNSDPPFRGISCNVSCHLECTLQHQGSGISKENSLDGSFHCFSCGKLNDLLCSWRKQVATARDTRRVDILCYRLSLAQKILSGTKLYRNINGIIEEAVKKLEDEVGPLTGLPVKMARGIVNRLSSGPDIQKLCASAVESLDSQLAARVSDLSSYANMLPLKLFRIEDVRASWLTLSLNRGDSSKENSTRYTLWHRKANDLEYPSEPTARMFPPDTFRISGLTPETVYFLKVVAMDNEELGVSESQFRTKKTDCENLNSKFMDIETIQSSATICSSLSNPSMEYETDNLDPVIERNEKSLLLDDGQNLRNLSCTQKGDTNYKKFSNGKIIGEASTDRGTNVPHILGLKCFPRRDSSEASRRIKSSKTEMDNGTHERKNGKKSDGKCVDLVAKQEEQPQEQAGSSSKKQNGERQNDGNGIDDKEFEYCVKGIRWLERDGHIETTFRQKFLTWYSLRATPREIRIVKVFFDMFSEDPESLAGQLVDTFSDLISNTANSTAPSGLCFKLWH